MKKSICLLVVLALTAGIMMGCGETKQADGTETTGTTVPTSGTTQTTQTTQNTQTTQTTQTTQSTTSDVLEPAQVLPVPQPIVSIWDLTEEERARIGAAEKYYPWDDTSWDWLGSECYVYAQFGDIYVTTELKFLADQEVTRDSVDGLLFVYNTSIRLNVLSGDRFYRLPEAYELGILTNEQLVQLHINYYAKWTRRMFISPRSLPDEIETELNALVQETYSLTQEALDQWGKTRMVGYFGYVLVLYEPVSGEPGAEIVEGMEFTYPDGTRLFVYYNGAAYSLQEAVDQGILRAEHLALVLDNHNYVRNGQ